MDSMTVYVTPGTVSPPAFRLARNAEPASCSTHAGHSAFSALLNTPADPDLRFELQVALRVRKLTGSTTAAGT